MRQPRRVTAELRRCVGGAGNLTGVKNRYCAARFYAAATAGIEKQDDSLTRFVTRSVCRPNQGTALTSILIFFSSREAESASVMRLPLSVFSCIGTGALAGGAVKYNSE